ncbi:MAG: CNNM domain-containing protein [Phycisphaerales bacterium]|jgi:CBS domain containing-hemolysin-like protein
MNERLEIALWLVGVMVCLVASGIVSGTEIGLYSLNKVRLSLRTAKGDLDAKVISTELARPARLLAMLLICNNIIHYLSAMAMTEVFSHRGWHAESVALISSLVLTPVLFVFGEALPKELFRANADRLTYTFAIPLRAVRVLLTVTGVLPVVRLLTLATERAAGLRDEGLSDARQRVAQLLKEGAGVGVLSESQVTLLDRALLLGNVTVGDEMTPWAKVRTLAADASRPRAIRVLGDVGHSWVPLIDRGGSVVGVLRQMDLFLRPDREPLALAKAPVLLAPATKVREALLELRQNPAPVGIVVDASGRPLGIVKPKDLVEALTGELADV